MAVMCKKGVSVCKSILAAKMRQVFCSMCSIMIYTVEKESKYEISKVGMPPVWRYVNKLL